MAKFKVGDRARLVSSDTMIGKMYIGEEVVIDGDEGVYVGNHSGRVYQYRIILVNFPFLDAACNSEHLEPITELGSWGEIEKATGWRPVVKKSFTTEKSI